MIPKLPVSLLTLEFLGGNSEKKLFMCENNRNMKQVVSLLGFQAEGKHGKIWSQFFNSKVAAYHKEKVNY